MLAEFLKDYLPIILFLIIALELLLKIILSANNLLKIPQAYDSYVTTIISTKSGDMSHF